LKAATNKNQPFDPSQPLEAEIDADCEEQEDDAQLGGGIRQFAVADESKAFGPMSTPASRKPTIGTSRRRKLM
jgi:hypothetical protein